MKYLVIGIKNDKSRGVDYTSGFIDDYAEAFATAEYMSARLGDSAIMSIVFHPFTDDALSMTLLKADFVEMEV